MKMINQKGAAQTFLFLLIIAIVGIISFLLIISTAPIGGLIGILNPKPLSKAAVTSTVTIDSVPAGLQITFDGQTRTTPFVVTADVGSAHTVGTSSPQQNSGAFQESAGLVQFEAEDYKANIPRGVYQWTKDTSTNWGGFGKTGFMHALPENTNTFPINFANATPELQYNINFQNTGTYYFWTRGRGNIRLVDYSIHGGLDGQPLSSASNMGSHSPNVWEWLSNTTTGPRATLNITTAGVHTLHIWMDYDGFLLDQIMLRQPSDSNFSFFNSGVNPNVSPQTGSSNFGFSNWSDGGALSHQITIPVANSTIIARFGSTTASPAPTATPTQIPTPSPGIKVGDLDNDGDIDIFDYSTLVTNFGRTGPGLVGDLDHDNDIDIFDYSTLVTNFGK